MAHVLTRSRFLREFPVHQEARFDSVVTKTADYTAKQSDKTILADATSGDITITLHPVARRVDPLHIKKIDSSANKVIVDGNGSEQIDDGDTADLTVQYEAITIFPTDTAWFIV